MVEREKRERIEKGSRERIEIERKETKGNRVNDLKRRIRNINTCLCLLFSFLKALRFSTRQKLLNSKGYTESPEFRQHRG